MSNDCGSFVLSGMLHVKFFIHDSRISPSFTKIFYLHFSLAMAAHANEEKSVFVLDRSNRKQELDVLLFLFVHQMRNECGDHEQTNWPTLVMMRIEMSC